MKKIRKRIWTHETACQWVNKVKSGREKYGLKYLSACDFLGIPANMNTDQFSLKFGL